jgi:DNA repair exonuclease SbcCD ATPase subunit
MSEENTRELSDSRSFEHRVFARFDAMERRFDGRFDAMDARFDGLDVRVQALESKALDTKPIWERALAEIVEVKESIYDIKRKFEIVTEDLLELRADQRRVEKRMDTIEARPQ